MFKNLGHTEEQKASSSSVSIELMSHYCVEVATKLYPLVRKVPKFKKFEGRKGDSKEHVVSFLDSLDPFAHNASRNFQNLWRIELTPGMSTGSQVRCTNWDHFMSMFNAKLFYVEAKFSLSSSVVYASARGRPCHIHEEIM